MNRLKGALRRFFFPPAGAKRWVRVLPYAVLGLLTLVVLSGTAVAWDYTNSSEFCGTSCHTMPPEYASYQASPHARVACVECHIGRGFIATQFTRKAGDLKHVFYLVFQNYEYPIRAKEMRPARDSCEKCHFPEKFSTDSLEEIKDYENDKFNSAISTYLIFKTGGGSKRTGLGRGIHWHIENPVYYYASDELDQDIPYVRVLNDDGTYSEYIDLSSGFDPASITEEELHEMDCITCHNRVTHLIAQPEDQVDLAISRGGIDPSIPEIRLKGVEVLRATYASNDAALLGIGALLDYYKTYYADFYSANGALVDQAIEALQMIYDQSVHIDQLSSWDTHPNNLGHKDFPGCFRCHDGEHLNASDEAIRLECNLCHSIPVVATEQEFLATIEISRGPEPESHFNANWIILHRDVFNTSCSNCHDVSDPGGVSNTSFCSNSACHGSVWTYAGFDAPALREKLKNQIPVEPEVPEIVPGESLLTYDDTIGPLLNSRCGSCHGKGGVQGLDLTTFAGLMAGSANGPVVTSGDHSTSVIYLVQSDASPHFSQFNPDELQLLVDWIDAGAPEK